ncbi:phage tail family protein [Sporolactobacillus sp. STSJ-5]|uniref:phage tail domain-containing protein n=1 Tax=Sporolactobacillus sp. STSJ-5 TaxID=2965076 RepID=UPI002103BB06|nr:phage tail domain-containing protein [Sporolactobacillus sp. STSJ-5]MCQ2009265.1 phage tail family protein [Sporolactobacillus sp. STSJ-5]
MRETLIIEKKDGTKLEINEIKGAHLISVDDQGPQPVTEYTQLVGVDGQRDNGTTFGLRVIQATFLFDGIDRWDYTLATREIWSKLFDYDAYYITWTRMPGIRYLVHCRPFQFTKVSYGAGSFTVEFEAPRGFGESIGRTDLDPINMQSDKYQMIGQGFPINEDLIYTHKENSFRIFNAGSIRINPRFQFLLIRLKGTGSPTLTNRTTGEVFKYNQTLGDSEELIIEGVYPKLNGVNCGRDTNHGLISLAPGWNDMDLTGLNNPESTFGFYFLYK